MFVRFRNTQTRLQVSLIETRRNSGKVRHEHVAALGSIGVPPTIGDRITFWNALYQRLAKLSNRITPEDHHKALAAIHFRVPMVTPDEQRQLQRENAEANAKLWSGLHDAQAEMLEGHKGLAATVERKISEGAAAVRETAAQADAAKERLARIDRGEDVQGGLGKPVDARETLRRAGWTAADIRRAEVVNELSELGGDAAFEAYLKEAEQRSERPRTERAAARAVLKRWGKR